ncbi:hypothetical protein [Pseudomonas zhanjiangensis]|uniref:DUF4410 domain-containing protein n=1 Tax=Pseudomonas zhanjiangensis TaxID=3239015 RepID=A0ABV3YSJ1_9PSED
MKLTAPLLCTLALSISPFTLAGAAGPLVIDRVQFAENVEFKKAQSECALQQRFATALDKHLRKQGFDPLEVDAAGATPAPRLSVVIESIWAPGGGAWSGPKRVNISGELKNQGEVLGSFVGQRSSTGGVFGGFKGTCGILARDVEALSRDIARWIDKPTRDARLGER